MIESVKHIKMTELCRVAQVRRGVHVNLLVPDISMDLWQLSLIGERLTNCTLKS